MPARDRLADPAHADDADLAVAQRADAERILLRRPEAGAEIAVGLDEFAQRGDQEPHRDVGDLLGQHIGRIGDHDVVLARVFGVDMVVADAERRHDLELGKHRDSVLGVAAHRVIGDRHAARARRDIAAAPARGRACVS